MRRTYARRFTVFPRQLCKKWCTYRSPTSCPPFESTHQWGSTILKRRSSKRTFCYPSKEIQLNRRISPVPSSLLPLWVHPLHPTTSSGSFLLTRGEITCANASTRYQHCEGTERRRNPTYLILVLRSIHTLSLNDTSVVGLLLSHTTRPGALMH